MKLIKSTFLKLIILSLLFSANEAYSQFGGFGKKLENAVKGAVEATDTDCKQMKRLKRNLEILGDYFDDAKNNERSIPVYIRRVEESIQSVKKNCSGTSTEKQEAKLAEYKKKWAGVTDQINAKENDEKYILETYWLVRTAEGNFGGYKGQFTNLKSAQKLYDDCKALDYHNTLKKFEDIANKYPEIKKEGHPSYYNYKAITTDFPNKFTEKINSYFTDEINKAIEESYALKAKGKNSAGDAKNKAKAAVLVCEAILMIFPDHQDVKVLYKDAKAGYDNIAAEFDAAVYSSDFHKQNVNKVVFANKPITVKQESSAGIKSEFKAGETIYALIYFDGSISEVTTRSYVINVNVYVDGNKKEGHIYKAETDRRGNSYYPIEIAPSPDNNKTNGGRKFTKALSELSPRNHKIEVKIFSNYVSNPLADGEFTLDCSSGLDKYKENLVEMQNAKLKSVRMAKAKMKNKSLEKSMLKALKDNGWNETPLRAVITDGEWTYKKNVLGVIISRVINAQVAVKRVNGTCAVFSLSFVQAKNIKKWAKTKLNGVGGSRDINCKNVNK